jgi:hypothetical protein
MVTGTEFCVTTRDTFESTRAAIPTTEGEEAIPLPRPLEVLQTITLEKEDKMSLISSPTNSLTDKPVEWQQMISPEENAEGRRPQGTTTATASSTVDAVVEQQAAPSEQEQANEDLQQLPCDQQHPTMQPPSRGAMWQQATPLGDAETAFRSKNNYFIERQQYQQQEVQPQQMQQQQQQLPIEVANCSAYVVVASRVNEFSSASWWLVDLSHEPPLEQGATALVNRCMAVYPDWDEVFARRVLKGYRQFLTITAEAQDWRGTKLTPPPLVDKMWEQHTHDIVSYLHDCMLLFGHVMGRNIYGFPSPTIYQEIRRNTMERLEARFGRDYDNEIWTHEPALVSSNINNNNNTRNDRPQAASGQASGEAMAMFSPGDPFSPFSAIMESRFNVDSLEESNPQDYIDRENEEPFAEDDNTNRKDEPGMTKDDSDMKKGHHMQKDESNDTTKEESDSIKKEESDPNNKEKSDAVAMPALSPSTMQVSVVCGSKKIIFKIKAATRMFRLIDNIPYGKWGIDRKGVQLVLASGKNNGLPLLPSFTAKMLQLQDGDQIDVILTSTKDREEQQQQQQPHHQPEQNQEATGKRKHLVVEEGDKNNDQKDRTTRKAQEQEAKKTRKKTNAVMDAIEKEGRDSDNTNGTKRTGTTRGGPKEVVDDKELPTTKAESKRKGEQEQKKPAAAVSESTTDPPSKRQTRSSTNNEKLETRKFSEPSSYGKKPDRPKKETRTNSSKVDGKTLTSKDKRTVARTRSSLPPRKRRALRSMDKGGTDFGYKP